MDIQHELEETKKRHVEIVNQINALEQRKQGLLQEALKLEGEIRALARLNSEPQKVASE